MLIDSHAHLEMPEFKKDLKEIIQRATNSGVKYIFTVGTEKKDWDQTLKISHRYSFLYAILGIHPHHAMKVDLETYSILRNLCKDDKVKAVGEIGLDFFKNLFPKGVQLRRFREQIGLAKELRLPIVVHDREAHNETIEILRDEKAEMCGGIIHCFSGNYEMVKECIELGFYISVPGSITFKIAERLREIVKEIPLDWLLVETDATFLAPEPFRGKRNEPAFVQFTAKKIPFERVAEATSENALKVFKIKPS